MRVTRFAGRQLRSARAASACLTRIPVGGFPYANDEWARAATWFPLVGAIVGTAAGGVWWVAGSLGPLVSSMLAVLTSVLMTGALHEDGLADTADALAARGDPDRTLEILRDPRMGTFGAVALMGSIGLRTAALATMTGGFLALVTAHAVARWTPVVMMARLPHVQTGGARSGPVMSASGRQVWGASVTLGMVLYVLTVVAALPMFWAGVVWLCAAVVAAVGTASSRRWIGGVRGDFLGAAEQATEVCVLLIFAAGSTMVVG